MFLRAKYAIVTKRQIWAIAAMLIFLYMINAFYLFFFTMEYF